MLRTAPAPASLAEMMSLVAPPSEPDALAAAAAALPALSALALDAPLSPVYASGGAFHFILPGPRRATADSRAVADVAHAYALLQSDAGSPAARARAVAVALAARSS